MGDDREIKLEDSIREKLFSSVSTEGNMQPCKITVVGAGMVGMACGVSMLLKNLVTDLVLMDVVEDKLKGEILDLKQGRLFLSNAQIDGGQDYKKTADSKIVIITAGARQKVGQSRLSLVQTNVNILKHIIPDVAKYSPNAIILVISNPVDLMTYVAWKLSGFPRHRILGSGTNLDSARFREIISERLQVSPSSVDGWIVGEHGDSSVPLWSSVSIFGRTLVSVEPTIGKSDGPKAWDKIHKQVVESANVVIKLKGYTNWAIGFSCAEIVESILRNRHRIYPVSCFVKGHAGIEQDVCLSLPCVLNASGVSSIVNISFKESETMALKKSAGLVYAIQEGLKW